MSYLNQILILRIIKLSANVYKISNKSKIKSIKKMYESKRFKINKRQKQSIQNMGFSKQMTIQEAYDLEKSKNLMLKERNEKLQIKCRFLYQKLHEDHKSPDDVMQGLNDDIWENDKKIKQLEQQLYFRYSKQMLKLKKKIKSFFQIINFDIDYEDLEKISDQIDLILLIIQVFQIKFDQLTNQRSQTNGLIAKLTEPEHITGSAQQLKQLQEEIQFFTRENNQLKELIRDLQRQVVYLKKSSEDQRSIQALKGAGDNNQINKAIQKHRARINQLQSEKSLKDIQIQKRNKKIIELQTQTQNLRKKVKMNQQQVQKMKRQDAKWKQRYVSMQEQKNQRIKLLQVQINRKMGVQNPGDSSIGFYNK